MPSAFLYLFIMLGVVLLWFMLLKRPIYEAVLISFIILIERHFNYLLIQFSSYANGSSPSKPSGMFMKPSFAALGAGAGIL